MRTTRGGFTRRSVRGALVGLCLYLGLCFHYSVAAAQDSTAGMATENLRADEAPDTQSTDAQRQEAESDTETEADACDWELEEQPFQEKSRETFRSISCHSFRWFDSLWGDRHDFDEDAVRGLITAGGEYSEYHGFDSRFRFRVRAPLPNMSSRWDLILGRVDEDSFISDTETPEDPFLDPAIRDRDEEPEWLLGLGHRGKARKSGWDYSVGVRLRLPPRPYVKARYYHNFIFNEKSDLRLQQTFFWRSDEGFGTTSRADLAYRLGLSDVLRWTSFLRFSEETEGADWYIDQTWYHQFVGSNAFSLRSFARGATDAPVEFKEYGLKFIWRRPFTRDWLHLSMGPTISWPRERLEEERDLSLGFLAWIEIEFGNWRY